MIYRQHRGDEIEERLRRLERAVDTLVRFMGEGSVHCGLSEQGSGGRVMTPNEAAAEMLASDLAGWGLAPADEELAKMVRTVVETWLEAWGQTHMMFNDTRPLYDEMLEEARGDPREGK